MFLKFEILETFIRLGITSVYFTMHLISYGELHRVFIAVLKPFRKLPCLPLLTVNPLKQE